MPLRLQRLSCLAVILSCLPLASHAAPFVNPASDIGASKASELVLVARNKRPRSEGVSVVEYPGGRFRKQGPRKWVEKSDDNDGRFQFREVGDDGRVITLFDRSRNVYVYLDFRREQIFYAPDGEEPRPLYRMTSVKRLVADEDEDNGEDEVPDMPKMARYTCEEGVPMQVRYENRGDRSLAFVSIDGSPEMRLKQIPAASGAKYSNGEYTVWSKGRNAILDINGDTEVCVGR
jgi:membrane-bound inhibitor of C-type lysozyme